MRMELEYTRRDIESVAEKEWGRIDIVEAGGGGSGDFSTCTVTIGSIVPTEGETPSIGAQVPLIILTEVGAEVKILVFRPNQNYDGYDIYMNQEKVDSPEITDVLVGQAIPYTFTTFDSVSAQGDIETVSGTFGSYIKINGNGTLNLVIHEGK